MATILLIDDDDLLRNTLSQMLSLDGHKVTEASDGDQGIAVFSRSGPFDLVITDILMPVVDGAQVIVELKKRSSSTPVLAISGGRRALSPDFSLESAQLAGACELLAKPFGRAQLQAAVQRSLDRPPSLKLNR